MAFKTLEQRYNEVSRQIYNRFSPSDDQLVKVLPDTNGVFGSNSSIKNDSRLLPLISTARDTKRISLFLASSNGVLFLGKQALLQTGNTFAETRLYNPLSALINTDPFVGRGTARHFGFPVGVKDLKSPTRDYRGALQSDTVSSFSSPSINSKLLSRFTANLGAVKNSILNANKVQPQKVPNTDFYKRPEDNYSTGIPLFTTQLMVERGNKRGITTPTNNLEGIHIGYYPSTKYVNEKLDIDTTGTKPSFFSNKRIPSFNGKYTFNGIKTGGYWVNMQGTGQKKNSVFNVFKSTNKPPVLLTADMIWGTTSRNPLKKVQYPLTKQIKTYTNTSTPTAVNPGGVTPFKLLENTNTGNGYFKGNNSVTIIATPDATPDELLKVENRSSNTGVTDPYNSTQFNKGLYSGIIEQTSTENEQTKTDIIKFIFKTTTKEIVRFRALISSIKENVKPEFNETRYVGRTERFVTYAGVKRTVSLQFNIVAFSDKEIEHMWSRINYLTGLAFPKGKSDSGFMIPPLFRITIGGIYEDQPCYIDNLDYDFLDDSITFDIDHEVSQVVNVNMSITLLEKRSKFYDSPFYKITEKLKDRLSTPTQQ